MAEGDAVRLACLAGHAGGRPVLTGFASSRLLAAHSFADTLDEDSGRGYQRRLNVQHSLDFRRYIQLPESTTPPLTFNLRASPSPSWRIEQADGRIDLVLERRGAKVMAQVDCQHRLGHLGDLDIELPFMTFIGLDERDEMTVFDTINGKAKGLSTSLLDYHQATLCDDLGRDRPELYIALLLRNEPSSPWYHQLDLGGTTMSGMGRRASLRTMQKALRHFVGPALAHGGRDVDRAAKLALEFWKAVVTVLPDQWATPRRHMLTKGIGVYALMEIAGDILREQPPGRDCGRRTFETVLFDFAPAFDWTSQGPLKGLGGESGVASAVELLRSARRRATFRIAHG